MEWLARTELARENFPRAAALTEQLQRLRPPSAADLVLHGNALYLLARDTDAERAFRAALALDPNDPEALYSLGRFLYQFQRYPEAAAQFQSLLQQSPNSHRAWDNLGLCQEAMGEPKQAIRSYLKAIELTQTQHRHFDRAHVNLANLLLLQDEPRRAFDLAATAVERNPSSAQGFYIGAKALVRLDQQATSVRWLKRAIELDPTIPEPHYLLATVLAKLGQPEEAAKARAEFNRLRQRQPARRR